MLSKLKIGSRLVMLISVQTVVLVIVGLTAIMGLNFAANTTESLNKNVIEQVKLNQLNETIRVDLLDTVNKVYTGKINWAQGLANLEAARNLFYNNWDEYKEDKSCNEVEEINSSLGNEYNNVLTATQKLKNIFAEQNKDKLEFFVNNDIPNLVNTFIIELNDRVNEQQLLSEQLFDESIETNKSFLFSSIVVIIIGFAIASLLGYFIFHSITRPIKQISTTVSEVSKGDYYARTHVTGKDELCELAFAFDNLLEDKVSTLVHAEMENEKLNDSVISLLRAVSQLSQRDLTVKVPVTEDVTGPVADALNQLTQETSRVLHGVRHISERVARASSVVKSQSDSVISVAENELFEVQETAKELALAVHAMNDIASLAQVCDTAAEEAMNTTNTALETVTNTVHGINGIRETIHETEKRIKRLGERSQEISRAVNLINNISERTHILALNASMHAASAGEAGRGFAVVADEVQRLAENAREATSQISTLVSNIQVETSDTVNTMNNVITQVVEGSRLAEQAGDQMQKTKDRTQHLVESVRIIVESSQIQARKSNELQGRATQIQLSTKKTSEQLHEQTQHTTQLVQFSRGLLNAVKVFKLPAITRPVNSGIPATAQIVAQGEKHKKAS